MTAEQAAGRRVKLYPWDSVASQLFEPYGESALDTLSLQDVWVAASKGNKKAMYHSHLCANQDTDPWHVGAGISLTAAGLLAAIKNFRSPDMKKLIVPAVYEKETLEAAKKFYAWLSQERTPFRSLLFLLSGSNTYFSAHCAEVVARASLHHKPITEKQFVEAMTARMSKMSAPASNTGSFENLGTSCFINAGIQVLLAIPGLADRLGAGFSPSERALTAVINTTTNRLGPVTPRPLTDLFYHGRQEDAAEFVLELLTGCSGLRELLEGVEHPRFRCRHCTYSRPAALEKFVSLQLPLMGTTRFVSVQEALNNYLNAEHVQEDLQDWVCCTDECLNAGRALDMPLYQTRITKWPDVLLIFLKRWDSAHGLLAHNVYCNNILMAEGNAYSLRSLITHIGHDPSSGHYVAYRHCQEGFRRLDDTRIAVASHVEGFFSRVPEEKVYVIVYHKQDLSNPSPAPVSRQPDDLSRRPAAKRLAIDLDSDSDAQKVSRNPDTDSDSDVVLARDDDPQSIGLPRDKDASVVPVTSADHIDIDADSGRTMTLAAWTCCMLEVAPLSG
ncbi:USP17L21, partial [Symbiodinium natans]